MVNKQHHILALGAHWLLLIAALFSAQQAAAGYAQYAETTISVEEDWLDDHSSFSVNLRPVETPSATPLADVFSGPHFGPFRIVSANMAELNGLIDSDAPGHFQKLLRQYPAIRMLKMTECEGTVDDVANMDLARIIRTHGIATWVPDNGSVRSGGVELFFAGKERFADDGAQFAVHSWMDEEGNEALDYPPNDPVHQLYISYYLEMGMDAPRARAFYNMTNNVPHDDALWLGRDDIARYIPLRSYMG